MRERQHLGGFAREQFAIGADFVGFRVDRDFWERVVPFQIALGNFTAALYGFDAFAEAIVFRRVFAFANLAHERDGAGAGGFAETAEHRAHENGLRRGDAGIGVAHLRPGDDAAFDDHLGFRAEKCGLPQHEISEFADFDRADEMAHAVRERGIDGVFRDISFDTQVVVAAFFFGQAAALFFHLVGGLPGARDDFADAAHGLRIGTHHADGAEIVENVLGGDGLAADAAFSERDVFG